MARHPVIDAYVADLALALPPNIVDELVDGLIETWHQQLAVGLSSMDAERATIAEFGSVDQVTREFVVQAPGRHMARVLLASGPLLGLCWGVSLVTARVWTWPVPTAVAAGYIVALLSVVAVLVAAGTSRRSYRRTRLGNAGAVGLAGLDALMIVAVATLAPTLVWPMAAAVPASLTRIAISLRALPSHQS